MDHLPSHHPTCPMRRRRGHRITYGGGARVILPQRKAPGATTGARRASRERRKGKGLVGYLALWPLHTAHTHNQKSIENVGLCRRVRCGARRAAGHAQWRVDRFLRRCAELSDDDMARFGRHAPWPRGTRASRLQKTRGISNERISLVGRVCNGMTMRRDRTIKECEIVPKAGGSSGSS